jgi:hypothetical protein
MAPAAPAPAPSTTTVPAAPIPASPHWNPDRALAPGATGVGFTTSVGALTLGDGGSSMGLACATTGKLAAPITTTATSERFIRLCLNTSSSSV